MTSTVGGLEKTVPYLGEVPGLCLLLRTKVFGAWMLRSFCFTRFLLEGNTSRCDCHRENGNVFDNSPTQAASQKPFHSSDIASQDLAAPGVRSHGEFDPSSSVGPLVLAGAVDQTQIRPSCPYGARKDCRPLLKVGSTLRSTQETLQDFRINTPPRNTSCFFLSG